MFFCFVQSRTRNKFEEFNKVHKDVVSNMLVSEWLAGLADDNAKVQAAAANMLNLALTLPDAPSDLGAVLVRA